jgi:acetylornithine deacetylase
VRVARDRGFDTGRLIIAAVVDEEFGSIGADALVSAWTADAAVVTEPTDLQIGVAHKGFAWIAVETRGRAAHGSRPLEGRDAIFRMGRVLQRFEQLDRAVQSKPPHPLLGTASLHASVIAGGRELSSYPDLCRLELERRTLPGETGDTFRGEADAILASLANEDEEFSSSMDLMFARPGYEIAADAPLPRAVEQAARRSGTSTSHVGMSFWTDAAILGAAGIPSVLFGPGGAGLHSVEEHVIVKDVIACRDALAELACDVRRVAGSSA